MFSGSAVVINTPRNVTEMARRIYASGVLPELEIFDGGDLQLAKALQEDGTLRNPLLILSLIHI